MSVSDKLGRVNKSIKKRRGICLICGERVHATENYIEAEEGYCHRQCLISETREQTVRA